MSVSAQTAIREWVNASPIVGRGNALSRGAYLKNQKSPADGAYTVLSRGSEGVTRIVAESGDPAIARMQFLVFAGTQDAAEAAASALRTMIEDCRGCPVRCGDTGTTILVTDNHLGPFEIPWATGESELFCFQVNADFVLTTAY